MAFKTDKTLYGWYLESRRERLEYLDLLSKNNLSEIFGSKLRPWNLFYEMPDSYFLALFAHLGGIESDLHSIREAEEFIQLVPKALAHIETALAELDSKDSEEEVAFLLMVVHVLMFNQMAIEQWGISINEVVSVIGSEKKQSDELLLKIIYTDRTVIGCPSIQRYLARKHLASDESFFVALSKSLTRTKPKRKEAAYEPMRYMFKVLLELTNSNKVRPKEAIRMCDDLGLFTEGKDPISAINKYVQRFNKQRRDIN
ncbi:MAG: hypothetical protein ACQEQ8_09635 [Pseudomonadota bacterium]